jgi:hypothetical protein
MSSSGNIGEHLAAPCIAGMVDAKNIRRYIKQETKMPRGDKSKYTDTEKRQAQHIEEGYEERGTPKDEAERRAWATVNKVHGGGEKPGGGGYGKEENHEPMKRGGAKGGHNSHKS